MEDFDYEFPTFFLTPKPGKKGKSTELYNQPDFNILNSSSTYSDLYVQKQDLHNKLIAAERANNQQKKKIEELKSQLEKISINGERSLEKLEKENEDLQDEYNELVNLTNLMPSVEFLSSQLALLNDEMEKVFGQISEEELRNEGVLESGEGINCLEKKINDYIVILNQSRDFSWKYVTLKKENPKKVYFATKDIVDATIAKKTKEKEELEKEVQKLREILNGSCLL